MKHTSTGSNHSFKRNHRFATTFLFMILLCFLLCISSYLFLMNMAITKARENSAHSNQSYINTEASNTNQMIYQLHQSLTQLSYSRSILNMIFYKEYEDINKNLVESDLALTSQNNLLIDSVRMYIPAQNMIITSDYHSYRYEDFEDFSMIEAYLENRANAVSYENTEKISSLFFYQGKLIMARDFPLTGPKRLATLFYTININQLYFSLTKELNKNCYIWVYDAHDRPIFSNIVTYPERITPDSISQLVNTAKGYELWDHSAFFYSSSDILQWKFVYQVEESAMLPFGNALRIMMIPIIILILILLVFSYLFVASGIYLPKQLTRLLSVLDTDLYVTDRPKDLQNEFDYLNHALTKIVGEQTEMKTTISMVSSNIQSRFFLELLSGVQMTEAEALKSLALSNSPFKVHAFYMVGVLSCEGDLAELESKRHYIQTELNHLMKEYNINYNSQSYTLLLDNRTFALILSFDLSDSLLKIIKEISNLEQIIKTLSKNQKIPMKFNLGRIYYNILDIGFSYRNALEVMSNHQQKAEAGTESRKETAPVNPDIPFPEAVNLSGSGLEQEPRQVTETDQRACQVLSFVRNGDLDNAMVLADRIIDEICQTELSGSHSIEKFRAFLSALSTEISHMDYIDFSSFHNELLIFQETQDLDPLETASKARYACREILTELSKMLKKQQNPYIIASQQYIREHYGNPNLSLNYVAEAIDVNPSYLSKLFTTNLGVNFTDYLNHYRIHYSMHLLKETDQSIQNIAAHTGFNSVQNFIRVFKKFTHSTPGQYRKEGDGS